MIYPKVVAITLALILINHGLNAAQPFGEVLSSEGLWKIRDSKSTVRFEGRVHENHPHWRYILISGNSIITFYKSGDPFWFATTTHIQSVNKTDGTWIIKTESVDGVKQDCWLGVADNAKTINFRRKWTAKQMDFESDRVLERVTADSVPNVLTDVMTDCRFLSDEQARKIVENYIRDVREKGGG